MTTVRVWRKQVPLAAQNAVQRWDGRESLLLCVEDKDARGCGEACPLPGVSPDDMAALESWLRPTRDWAGLPAATAPAVFAESARLLPPPSLRYALELACFDLHAQREGVPLFHLLSRLGSSTARPATRSLPARLFYLWQDDYLQQCETLVAQMADQAEQRSLAGALTLKVKVGRDPTAEAQRLGELRKRFPAVRLRLDANRSLDARDWEDNLARFACHDIEFIEEPCPPSALGIPRLLPAPIAFDETLHEGHPQHIALLQTWLDSAPVAALILKPMLLGGFEKCLEWVARARQSETDVIFSHAFDGTVAMRSYQHWDRAFGSARFAAGLGAHPGLALWHELVPATFSDGDPLAQPGLGLSFEPIARFGPCQGDA